MPSLRATSQSTSVCWHPHITQIPAALPAERRHLCDKIMEISPISISSSWAGPNPEGHMQPMHCCCCCCPGCPEGPVGTRLSPMSPCQGGHREPAGTHGPSQLGSAPATRWPPWVRGWGTIREVAATPPHQHRPPAPHRCCRQRGWQGFIGVAAQSGKTLGPPSERLKVAGVRASSCRDRAGRAELGNCRSRPGVLSPSSRDCIAQPGSWHAEQPEINLFV